MTGTATVLTAGNGTNAFFARAHVSREIDKLESFPFFVPKRPLGATSASAKEYSLSRESAVELADKVNSYWANLGYDAEARVVEVRLLGRDGNAENFTVVSNLRNGVPARRLADVKR